MTVILAAGITVAPSVLAVADKAQHANTYVGIGAGTCAILTGIGLPLWRALRAAKKERAHQTEMLTRVHGGMFGKAAVVENGVTVEGKEDGLIDRVASLEAQFQEGSAPLVDLKNTLDRNHRENSARLDRHEERLSRVEHVAGSAATEAASAKDRLEFLSGRWWERMEGLDLRNQFLTSVAQEQGFDVGTMPPIDEDNDGSVDVHGA